MKTSLFLGTALMALLVTSMASAATKSYATDSDGLTGAQEKNNTPRSGHPEVNTNMNAECPLHVRRKRREALRSHQDQNQGTEVITGGHIYMGQPGPRGPIAIHVQAVDVTAGTDHGQPGPQLR